MEIKNGKFIKDIENVNLGVWYLVESVLESVRWNKPPFYFQNQIWTERGGCSSIIFDEEQKVRRFGVLMCELANLAGNCFLVSNEWISRQKQLEDEVFERQLFASWNIEEAIKKHRITIKYFYSLPKYSQRNILLSII